MFHSGDHDVKTNLLLSIVAVCLVAGLAAAQDRTQPAQAQGERARNHEPPQQAYDDCKGKKAGDAVRHTTPEGTVDAVCAESPKGLVARPVRPHGAEQGAKPQTR